MYVCMYRFSLVYSIRCMYVCMYVCNDTYPPLSAIHNRVLQLLCVLAVEVLLRVISVAVRDSEMVISMVMLAVPIAFYVLLMISGVKIQQAILTIMYCMHVCSF